MVERGGGGGGKRGPFGTRPSSSPLTCFFFLFLLLLLLSVYPSPHSKMAASAAVTAPKSRRSRLCCLCRIPRTAIEDASGPAVVVALLTAIVVFFFSGHKSQRPSVERLRTDPASLFKNAWTWAATTAAVSTTPLVGKTASSVRREGVGDGREFLRVRSKSMGAFFLPSLYPPRSLYSASSAPISRMDNSHESKHAIALKDRGKD